MHQFFDDPLPATFRDTSSAFANLGLRVQLTEMDVLTDVFPGDLAARLEQQRHVYHDAVAVCLAVEGCEAVTFWGFTDKHSWIDTFFGRIVIRCPSTPTTARSRPTSASATRCSGAEGGERSSAPVVTEGRRVARTPRARQSARDARQCHRGLQSAAGIPLRGCRTRNLAPASAITRRGDPDTVSVPSGFSLSTITLRPPRSARRSSTSSTRTTCSLR